jgi:hypothetical protein
MIVLMFMETATNTSPMSVAAALATTSSKGFHSIVHAPVTALRLAAFPQCCNGERHGEPMPAWPRGQGNPAYRVHLLE